VIIREQDSQKFWRNWAASALLSILLAWLTKVFRWLFRPQNWQPHWFLLYFSSSSSI